MLTALIEPVIKLLPDCLFLEPCDFPEIFSDQVPVFGHVSLHLDFVPVLQLFKDESTHYAVAHNKRKQSNVW